MPIWQQVTDPSVGLHTSPYISGNPLLYQWGPLQFTVWPLNVNEFDHETGTDWARKEIAGAAIYREWVGENDSTLNFRGKMFPYRLGGMASLDAFDQLRQLGVSSMLLRGDGKVMGWFVCEHLIRKNQFLSSEGVGQHIDFEAVLTRVPVPDGSTQISQLWGVLAP